MKRSCLLAVLVLFAGVACAEKPQRTWGGSAPAPEFPAGLDWLNTGGEALSLAGLRGKVVLLDFWTYGCINCFHIIPDLERLEAKYPDTLVVIGVHSAKFESEGETANIRRMVARYGLAHPVVNDRDYRIWKAYGARAWPTLALVDPEGNYVGAVAGEGHYELLDEAIGGLVAEFGQEDKLDRTPLELEIEDPVPASALLRFPGKVLADEAGGRLFIADSNAHRIVETDLDGRIRRVFGTGEPGLADGAAAEARFNYPQGMALADDTLYVADTRNHALRAVALDGGRVTTVAGTGEKAYQTVERGPARDTGLNSPWDVLWLDDVLYIAMAGQHQLWAYDPEADEVRVFAGSRREELRDGGLTQAGFNQPSGLATDGKRLFVADSEASAIRSVTRGEEARVTTLVGTGLFDFGDKDGRGDEVRLQHPLAVAWRAGTVYVADTYNGKIKRLDPESRTVTTLATGFDEPGGLSIAGERLYVADTNDHAIKVVALPGGEVSTLELSDPDDLLLARNDQD